LKKYYFSAYVGPKRLFSGVKIAKISVKLINKIEKNLESSFTSFPDLKTQK